MENMTGNEIIKGYCKKKLCPLAQEVIDRQKVEIERLWRSLNEINKYLPKIKERAKTEAIKEVLLILEAEAESSDKYIREYEDSKEQRAYNQALWKSYNLVKEMTEGDEGK